MNTERADPPSIAITGTSAADDAPAPGGGADSRPCAHCGRPVPQRAAAGRPFRYCRDNDGSCQRASRNVRLRQRNAPGLAGHVARVWEVAERLEQTVETLTEALHAELSPSGVERQVAQVRADAAAHIAGAEAERDEARQEAEDARAALLAAERAAATASEAATHAEAAAAAARQDTTQAAQRAREAVAAREAAQRAAAGAAALREQADRDRLAAQRTAERTARERDTAMAETADRDSTLAGVRGDLERAVRSAAEATERAVRTQVELAAAREATARANAEAEAARHQTQDARAETARLATELDQARTVIDTMGESGRHAEQQWRAAETDRARLTQAVADLTARLATAERDRDVVQGRADRLGDQVGQLAEALAALSGPHPSPAVIGSAPTP